MRWFRMVCFGICKRKMLRIAEERAKLLEELRGQLRERIQLAKLNSVWEDAWRNVPYYAALRNEHNLPDRFRNVGEFCAKVPALEKQDLRKNQELFRRWGALPDDWVATGGSTGESLCVAVWKDEAVVSGANHLIGRSWYGVLPGDKLLIVWGHAHLLGSGWRRWVRSIQRQLKDRFLGYRRLNAYFLDEMSLARMAKAYIRYRPDYVVGYSGALTLLARQIRGRARFRPKVVIGCAEGFANVGNRQYVSEAFQAPVSMEYGSVECDLIAHEHPQGGYRVFWDTHLVEAERPSSSVTPILVTKLMHCYTPLIRYRIGDDVALEQTAAGPLERFAAVVGRTDDMTFLPNGTKVHWAVIDDALCEIRSVLQFQLVRRNGQIEAIRIRTEGKMTEEAEAAIRSRLGRVSCELAALPIIQVNDMPKTLAGKIRWYVDG